MANNVFFFSSYLPPFYKQQVGIILQNAAQSTDSIPQHISCYANAFEWHIIKQSISQHEGFVEIRGGNVHDCL